MYPSLFFLDSCRWKNVGISCKTKALSCPTCFIWNCLAFRASFSFLMQSFERQCTSISSAMARLKVMMSSLAGILPRSSSQILELLYRQGTHYSSLTKCTSILVALCSYSGQKMFAIASLFVATKFLSRPLTDAHCKDLKGMPPLLRRSNSKIEYDTTMSHFPHGSPETRAIEWPKMQFGCARMTTASQWRTSLSSSNDKDTIKGFKLCVFSLQNISSKHSTS